jgi:SAM-dependent methyltransferase
LTPERKELSIHYRPGRASELSGEKSAMLERFRIRRREPEIMDQPGLDEQSHRRALAGLRRINRFSRTGSVAWTAIERLVASDPGRTWRVLDVASGGGDVAIDVARRAVQRGMKVLVDACDISPFAVRYACARAAERRVENVSFFRCNVLDGPLPEGYDIVMCSLFLHHLDEENAVALLSKMAAAARKLVVVNDLRRSAVGYLLAWLGCRILTRSPVVHVDGPRSVQAAFSLDEMRGVARRSGLESAVLQPRWPCRLLLQWSPA